LYKEDNGELRITGYTGSESVLEIPAEIDGKPVTVIGMHSLDQNTNLVSVTIPDSVKVLDILCFSDCTNLKDVTLGSQVVEIQSSAFARTAIEQITIPDTVEVIGNNAFDGSQLKEITIPSAISALYLRCFAETNLEHVVIPANVKTIYPYAFKGNKLLQTVLIEEGVEKLDNEIFSECSAMKSIAFPASVTEMSEDVLLGCIPNTGKLKIYVVSGSVAESVINESYGDKEYYEIISLENMYNIETIMDADRQEAETTVPGQMYYVKLISAADDKVMAIKVYREFTGEGLKETKDKIDAAPCILLETASEETAKALLEELQQLNVVVDPDIYTETINGAE